MVNIITMGDWSTNDAYERINKFKKRNTKIQNFNMNPEDFREYRKQKILQSLNEPKAFENAEMIIYSVMNTIRDSLASSHSKKSQRMELKKMSQINISDENKESEKELQKTKIMASLVPDEIIYNHSNYSHRNYLAALMFADVSGFTELCEKYNQTGRDGTSRLTQVLNSYIGAMVQEILSHGGDLLKFSGDAFLAMWKSTDEISIQNAVHTAIDCALVIQRDYGAINTDVGVILRVKVAISGGHVTFSMIGNKDNSHYAVVGQPVWDVKKAEYMSKAGDVIASPSAWQYVNPSQYVTKPMLDGVHTNVFGIGATWKHVDTVFNFKNDRNDIEFDELEEIEDTYDVSTTNQDFYNQNIEMIIQAYADKNVTNFRQSINFAMKNNLQEQLKRFMLLPVMKAIEIEEPLDYLTEMRYVVILFLNIITEVKDSITLLSSLDEVYSIVCSLVTNSNGIVNKVSLFDKDLMILVVFGLRGLKHEMDIHRALFCSAQLRKNLCNLKDIQCVSIGVTSGLAYCGLVGHTVRREYTVIGLCVNKAARLMVAYPDKIACDKEVFLQSKISASYFKLLEHKALKGLTNIGPVYQYNDDQRQHLITVNNPLVGREYEVQIIKDWIHHLLHSNSNYVSNLLIIKGEPTSGKMRLLDDMMKTLPKNLPAYRIILPNDNGNNRYEAINKIITCGMRAPREHDPSLATIEAKIKELANKYVPFNRLCFINEILHLRFPLSDEYVNATRAQKRTVYKDILLALCERMFTSLHLIAIHQGEEMDIESWQMIPTILKVKQIALVITLDSNRLTNSPFVMNILENPKAEVINLKGISRWHHTNIVCQALNVQAVSPEFERLVQGYSDGLPGWIEKVIHILIQSGELSIKTMSREEAMAIGAVMPLENETNFRTQDMQPSTSKVVHTHTGTSSTDWAMFKSSYRKSGINADDKSFSSLPIKVAVLEPSYSFDDMQIEITSYVIFLKTYDQLTPFEKLLLKCGSALGEIFNRILLLSVLKCKADRSFASAIAKLFDAGFLECAGGDFTRGENGIFIRPILETFKGDKDCHCKGINIQDEDKDLPKYALCGYMRFCNTKFFIYAYDLLTENQKRDFHNRSINFLENNIRKCKSCGGGQFKRILGIRKSQAINDNEEVSEAFIERLKNGGFEFKYFRNQSDSTSHLDVITDASMPKISYIYSEDTLFNLGDLLNCECEMYLAAMYTQIISHCEKCDIAPKLLEAYLEYAELKINERNIQEAMVILSEVDKFVQSPKFQMVENNAQFAAWQKRFVLGRISSTRGRAMYEYGDFEEAKKCLLNAMALFDHPFPTTKYKFKLKLLIETIKQKLTLNVYSQPFVGNISELEAIITDQLSETLGHLFNFFMITGDKKSAYLAAVWSFNCVLKANNNFSLLCLANANMIVIGKLYYQMDLCKKLVQSATKMCAKVKHNLDITEVHACTELFTSIYLFRVMNSDTEFSTEMGFKLLNSLKHTKSKTNLMMVFVTLSNFLVMRMMFHATVKLVKELKYHDSDEDISCKTWYFAKALDILLDSGYTLETYERCAKFYLENGDSIIYTKFPEAGWHFIINMWVRCLRIKEWDTMITWMDKAKPFFNAIDSVTNNILTILRFYEGMLLVLVWEMDNKTINEFVKSMEYLKIIRNKLNTVCKHNTSYLPRLYLLNAYDRHITHNDSIMKKYIREGRQHAVLMNNYLITELFDHSEKAWDNTLNSQERTYWLENTQPGNEIRLDGMDNLKNKIIPFTFPSPIYRL